MSELKYSKQHSIESFDDVTSTSSQKITINTTDELYKFLIDYSYYPAQKIFINKENNAIQYSVDNVITDSINNTNIISFNINKLSIISLGDKYKIGIEANGALGLSVLMDRFIKLTKLDLNANNLVFKNNINGVISYDNKAFIELIKTFKMSNINALNLANNNIDNDSLIELSSHLPSTKSEKNLTTFYLKLYIHDNIFNDKGAIIFINKLIKTNTQLELLFIKNKNITKKH